jgi:flagellar biosynthesis/type III secretory pathway protein FliH
MTYILLFNNTLNSCETDQLILSKEQAKHIETSEQLLQEISELKKTEKNCINAAELKGFSNGYNKGLNKSLDEAKSHFIEYLASITRRVIETHTLSEKSILDLAINITQKIAHEVGSENMIAGIAQRAIKNLKSEEPLEIRVNSELAEYVKQKVKDLLHSNSGLTPHIEVIPDPNIGKLDCIITSDSGVTEASFEQQIYVLKENINKLTKKSNQDIQVSV